jgi:hypothetical protein
MAGWSDVSGRVVGGTTLRAFVNMLPRWAVLIGLAVACGGVSQAEADYFTIAVKDSATGRGVPLVKLTANGQVYYTDSNGVAAVSDPSLLNRNLTFLANSYGYTTTIQLLQTTAGTTGQVSVGRLQPAERLYRVTGAGIYQDSVNVGLSVPIDKPLLNANVKGQDSVQAVVYNNQINWFWGDTLYQVGFGNFRTSGATSQLPGMGGLSPSQGVNLNYYVDASGNSKEMMPLTDPGPVWIDGLFTVKDNAGQEKMLTHYSRRDPNNALGAQVEQGLALFDDASKTFQRLQVYDLNAPITANGHSFEYSVNGQDYIYFTQSYPDVRVKADWDDVNDLSSWEAFTPLKANSRYNAANPPLDYDAHGKLIYGWKKNTDPLTSDMMEELVQNGYIARNESPFRLQDVATGSPIHLHRASVYWNDYRHDWIMIGNQENGTSPLGEVWFSEAPTPEGPWANAIKVATHHSGSDNYTFYNPTQDPFFDEDGGRIIYFEGTYSNTFSGNSQPTPLYDYNQMMYRLDLSTIPSLLPPTLAGDYNGDGKVDAADYIVWRDTFGSTTDLRANGDNSGASQGVIDQADYLTWMQNFGATQAPGSAATVPEPSSVVLLVAALGAVGTSLVATKTISARRYRWTHQIAQFDETLGRTIH